MIQKGYYILFIFILFSGFACGDLGRSNDERAEEASGELNDLHREAAERWCECYADDDNYSRCINDHFERFDFSACQQAAAACYVNEYEDHLGCEREAIREFRYCLSECSSAQRNCINDYRRAQDYCVEYLSEDLKFALLSCDLGTNFSCR